MESDNVVQMELHRKENSGREEVKIDYQFPSKKLPEPNLGPIDNKLANIDKRINGVKERVPFIKGK